MLYARSCSVKKFLKRKYCATIADDNLNRNIKRFVPMYFRYGQQSLTFRALALRQRETLETLDFTIHIGSTLSFLYFDFHLYSTYAAHYVYFTDNLVFFDKDII